jgi:putative protease
MSKIEILAPAGGMDSVYAGVKSGADAVYLGLKDFSARKEAQNFSYEELKETTEYCHIRGVKVYVTMNTLVFDDEMESAINAVKKACECNIDALIVQDIGFANLVHKCCPSLHLHGSTQMSVHTLSGAKLLKEMGFTRVVLSREMSMSEIKYIADNIDIELEVFVHGALCMCVSGQCYFSAMLGGRSGNRGYCAQPCRLPFNVKNCDHALSLKDNSIIFYLDELEKIGVASAKIEGRMKRPEYVASAVKACYEKRENGFISLETFEQLKSIFSRTGFTDGYYKGNLGKDMFGYRKKENVISATEGLFKSIRNSYKDEMQKIPLKGSFSTLIGNSAKFTISDGINSVTIESAEITEPAVNVPLTEEKAKGQLSKTGGTPFFFENITLNIQEKASIPLSVLNKIRRSAIEAIEEKRKFNYNYSFTMPSFNVTPARHFITEKRAEYKYTQNINFEDYSLVFIPYETNVEKVAEILKNNSNVGIIVPRGLFGRENAVIKKMEEFKKIGINDVLCNNLGAVYFSKSLGFRVHGGEFLNLTNTWSLMWAQEFGLDDVILSIELTDERINSLGGNIPRGIVSYGYIPLMLTRNCPMKSGGTNCKSCKKRGKVQDRKNIEFLLSCDGNCTEILNSVKLNILSKINEKFSTDFHMEKYYVENYVEKVENYNEKSSDEQKKIKFTNGLYFRGVK